MALAAGALAATAGHLLAVLGIDAIKNGITATVDRAFKDIEITDGLRATIFAYINSLEEPFRSDLNDYYEKARLNKRDDPFKEDRIVDMFARCYLIKEDDLRKVAFEVLGQATDTERDAVLEFISKNRLATWYLLTKKYGRDMRDGFAKLYEKCKANPKLTVLVGQVAESAKTLGGGLGQIIANLPAHRAEARAWMREYTERLRHEGELRRTSTDRPRRFRHLFSALLWVVVIMGLVFIVGLAMS